jgi:hypothetical protein
MDGRAGRLPLGADFLSIPAFLLAKQAGVPVSVFTNLR